MDFSAIATTEEDVLVTLNPKTKRGNPAVLEGMPIVTVLSGAGTFDVVDETHVLLHTTDSVDGIDTKYSIKGNKNLAGTPEYIEDTVTLTTVGAPADTLNSTLSNVPKP